MNMMLSILLGAALLAAIPVIAYQRRKIKKADLERRAALESVSAAYEETRKTFDEMLDSIDFSRNPKRDWLIEEGYKCHIVCRRDQTKFVAAAVMRYDPDEAGDQEYALRCAEELRDMLNLDIAPKQNQ